MQIAYILIKNTLPVFLAPMGHDYFRVTHSPTAPQRFD